MIINCDQYHLCGKKICCGYCNRYNYCINKCKIEEGPEVCGYNEILD